MGQSPGVASGHHQNRNGLTVRLGNAAKGVFSARAMLHDKDPNIIAARKPAHCICHVQADSFLPDNNGSDVCLGSGLDNGVNRIANNKFDAFLFQNSRDGLCYLHTDSFNRLISACLPTGWVRVPWGKVATARALIAAKRWGSHNSSAICLEAPSPLHARYAAGFRSAFASLLTQRVA